MTGLGASPTLPTSDAADAGLAARLAQLREALTASREAPLSLRRAMLAFMLVDAIVDDMARRPGSDPLRARADLAGGDADLALVLEVAAHRADSPRLAVESVSVPLAQYGSLTSAEFMVSLYNQHTVPRLKVVGSDGGDRDAHAVLAGAVAALERVVAQP